MADTKTTALTANTAPLTTDLLYMVDDPGGSALSQKITFAYAREILSGVSPTGRLTLTTAVPVTTADVTAAATLYYTPYNGNLITLYDGTSWRTVSYTEKSLALGALTASKPYDIWGYLDSGTLALEALIWTDATNRATALAYQDGRLVKSGAATRLYLGSIYINSSGGQTDDSVTKRNVYNYYNRRFRDVNKAETTSHTYNSTTIRYWNNDTAQFIEYMCGVIEDPLTLSLYAQIYASNTASPARALLTFDGATSINVLLPYATCTDTNGVNVGYGWASSTVSATAIGRHTVGIMEYITASTNAATFVAARMFGGVWA